MGILLDFASAPRPASRVMPRRSQNSASRSEGSGEVILFPGVRYERAALDLSARIGTISQKAGPVASDQD
jgi:hypothetical protein